MSTDQTSGRPLDLVVRSSEDLTPALIDSLESMLLTGEVDDSAFTVVTDPVAAEREIIRQLLDAKTDDELEGSGAIGWQKLQDVPVQIDSFKYLPSTFKSNNPNYVPNPVYFVVFGKRMDDGSDVILTTGSKGVCAQLVNLAKRGRIPGCIRMLKAMKTREDTGNTPFRLVSTDAELAAREAQRLAGNAPAEDEEDDTPSDDGDA